MDVRKQHWKTPSIRSERTLEDDMCLTTAPIFRKCGYSRATIKLSRTFYVNPVDTARNSIEVPYGIR